MTDGPWDSGAQNGFRLTYRADDISLAAFERAAHLAFVTTVFRPSRPVLDLLLLLLQALLTVAVTATLLLGASDRTLASMEEIPVWAPLTATGLVILINTGFRTVSVRLSARHAARQFQRVVMGEGEIVAFVSADRVSVLSGSARFEAKPSRASGFFADRECLALAFGANLIVIPTSAMGERADEIVAAVRSQIPAQVIAAPAMVVRRYS